MQRSTLLYGTIIGLMCAAIVVVAILILRKRAIVIPVPSLQTMQQKTKTPLAPQVRPIDSYQPERPFQPGDPIPDYPQESITESPSQNPQ